MAFMFVVEQVILCNVMDRYDIAAIRAITNGSNGKAAFHPKSAAIFTARIRTPWLTDY